MQKSRASPLRSASAPPEGKRHYHEPNAEDIAAADLAATYTVVWQLYDDQWDCWYDYTDRESELLESSWQEEGGNGKVPISANGEEFTVNVIQLQQKNERTGKPRNIRRVLVAHDGSLLPADAAAATYQQAHS